MTKPSIRTVNKRYNNYYDETEDEIDNLLAKLDLAKAQTTKAATELADAKEALLKTKFRRALNLAKLDSLLML
jgi:hypothetical protein